LAQQKNLFLIYEFELKYIGFTKWSRGNLNFFYEFIENKKAVEFINGFFYLYMTIFIL